MIKECVDMFADGASRGNPGLASYGVTFQDSGGVTLFELSEKIGIETNNVAEYSALLEGLRFAIKNNIKRIHVFLDSQLVVRQVLGQYRIRAPRLKVYYTEVLECLSFFDEFSIKHIPRKENKKADFLANMALDSVS